MKEGWKETNFGNFVDCNPKISIKKGQVVENCEMEDINPDYKFLYPREGKLYNGSNSKFQNGDTVFARITPCLENGKIAQIKDLKTEAAIGSTEFFVFRGKSQVSDNEFIYYLSKSNLVRDTAVNSMTGASGRQRADLKALKKLKIKVPSSVKHQQRIASILYAYDDLIEVNNKRIELLEQSARELYKEWFVRMRFPNYQNTKFNKGIPEGWEEKSPFDISEVLYGYPFNSSLFNENEGIPVVRIRDIIANSKTTFTIENIDNRYLLNDGDILIGMDGDFHIQRWMNGIAYINQRVVRLRAKTDCIYNSCFIENVIREPIFFLNSIIVGTTVAHLSDKDMKKIKLLIPTDDLIIKFKILTDPVTETIITLFKQNQQLTEIRNRLLPRLISGKLEIKE
ncbi:restriction endonuclease subunit S [Apibacter mensalis]|uniref:restriction endonuclease subunit S n=1 Tax=Apibacter mensalis TaxID=1586267 RepID=UPI0026F3537E|nr:restriction endonuclease subunit S [Apibacter mensalis]